MIVIFIVAMREKNHQVPVISKIYY